MDFAVTIRNAKMHDLPAIVDIYNSTVPTMMVTADTSPVSVESRKAWFADHCPLLRPIWVAEHEGRACGWLSFQSYVGRPAYDATAEISIYLHEDYRGRGLGRFLLNKAMEACPELRIKTLLVFIFSHNLPSLGLFEHAGFQKWGYLPQIAELDGTERDVAILGKRIAPPPPAYPADQANQAPEKIFCTALKLDLPMPIT